MNPRRGSGRSRRSRNSVTTKSGNTIKLNRSLSDRIKAKKAARAAEKATYLATLPKNKFKRAAYRMHPKRLADYWFSREGGIMALKIIGVAIIAGFFLTIGMFAYFRKDLPKIKDISGQRLGGSITYYDRTGQTVLWQDYDAVKRIPVKDEQISPYMKQATVAIEDKDFYKHGAFDTRGSIRAAANDVTGGGPVQGGSTITQQLVKLNEGWTDNRTITRKVKELILAVELEREYSKKDILTGYLNMAPYGGVEYGVESAARDYFQTTAKDLTLAQASMLASIPQAPGYYSPYSSSQFNEAVTSDTFNRTALLNRQHYVLDKMVENGYITQQQADEAKQVDVLAQIHKQTPKYAGIKAPYFVLAAKSELEKTYGASTVQRGGWKVITTLNMDLQNKAEELVKSNLYRVKSAGGDNEAMVNEDVETGQIVSLVGGIDFNNPLYGQDNYAASVKIPPGSSFKPYDYAAFIENNNNVGSGSVLYDDQTPLPGYPCTDKSRPPPKGTGNCLTDYDFKNPGAITLRYALGGSRNIPAVKAMLSAVPNDKSNGKTKSINKTISTASAMMANKYDQSRKKSSYNCYSDEALTKTTQCYGASAIGDGAFLRLDDHVNGLSTMSRLGKAIPRTYIMKVTDAANKNIYEWKKPVGKQVIKPDTAYIVNDMASDPRASYLPSAYKFHKYDGWKFAIKTGTTNNGYDGLMTSWSTKYATVAWVGNHTRNVEMRSSMEVLTSPLVRGWMEYAHKNEKAKNWEQPKGLKTSPAFVVRSHVALGSIEPSPANDLYPSWYVGGKNNAKSKSQTLDKVSNKVATACTPPAAKETAYNSNAAFWNADQFKGGVANIGKSTSGGSGTSSSDKDDVHNCNDSPPTVTLTAPSSCPQSGCTITATVTQGTHRLTDPRYPDFPGRVTITLNGRSIYGTRVNDSPSTVSFNYKPTSTGSGTLTATVTDSVLYSGSQSMPFSFQGPSPITVSGNSNGNGTATITWTGGRGSFTVYVGGSPSGCQSSGCTVTVGGGTPVYVRDGEGNTSNTITVSGN